MLPWVCCWAGELKTARQNNHSTRRIRDLFIAILALLLLWPLMIVIGLTVFLCSGAPIIYREGRMSRGEGRFTIYKFRTMWAGEESFYHVAPDNDPRITRLGLWLRRWRLDELPQLFNILRGDMSIVGPRPLHAKNAAAIPESKLKRILSVAPGITGRGALEFLEEDHCLAQLSNPEKVFLEKLLPARIERELEYLDDPDPCKDWRIIWETLTTLWFSQARHKSEKLVKDIISTN